MPATVIRGKQILDGTVQRADLDVSTVGQAVVAKLLQGSNISLSSTGGDAGTGDVTVSANGNMNWRGNWSNTTAYAVNDVVDRSNGAYSCLTANTGQDPLAPGGTISMGNTAQGGTSGAYTGITAVKVTLAQAGTLQSVSVFNLTTGITLLLGVYTDPGGSSPGTLLAQGSVASSVAGANTATVPATALAAGTYWLAVQGSTSFTGYYDASGTGAWNNSFAYTGTLPTNWPTSGGGVFNFSLYATLTTSSTWWQLVSGGVSADAGNTATVSVTDNRIMVSPSAIQPVIWSQTRRVFQALGNSTFEIDQRTCLTGITNSGWVQDRWNLSRGGTMTGTAVANFGLNVVPGTSFNISQYFLRVTLTGQQASLGASDFWFLSQAVEGPILRELISDVSSFSLLVRSSVAGLKFGITFRDGAATPTKTLAKLATITSANTWTLLQFATLPSFASSGASYALAPGNQGYSVGITLCAGTSLTASSNDVWVNANVIGASGQDNFASKVVNSTFDLAYVGHEPGPLCTTPQDLSLGANLDGPFGCQRYFTKSYKYGDKPGTAITDGGVTFLNFGGWGVSFYVPFKKTMAKIPTITGYSPATGATNNLRDLTNNADRAITGSAYQGDAGFSAFNISGGSASTWQGQFHYTADTGW